MSSLDELFKLLSDKPRRHIIYILNDRNGPVSLQELTAHLADHPTISSDQRSHLEIELYHNHIPQLADQKFIQYDQDEGLLELTNLPPEAKAIIAAAKEHEDPAT